MKTIVEPTMADAVHLRAMLNDCQLPALIFSPNDIVVCTQPRTPEFRALWVHKSYSECLEFLSERGVDYHGTTE